VGGILADHQFLALGTMPTFNNHFVFPWALPTCVAGGLPRCGRVHGDSANSSLRVEVPANIRHEFDHPRGSNGPATRFELLNCLQQTHPPHVHPQAVVAPQISRITECVPIPAVRILTCLCPARLERRVVRFGSKTKTLRNQFPCEPEAFQMHP